VGKKAYDAWVSDPENTQAEFKRWMGFSDRLTFAASGKTMSAEELSAEVLKSLRADAVRQTQDDFTAAVITVPAAFGALQCEATGRAAKLAGFEEAALLQEPIAAAIAYGATPASQNQRWMVFDLGGGTLDIAIVSTRNGRLSVLEHQGDNRLGGKDIDKLIAEELLLAPLAQSFALPDGKDNPAAFNSLFRALVRQAEQAKIQLSSVVQVSVDLFDLGEDRNGKPIELTVSVNRTEVESRMAELLDRCIALAMRAMEGARLAKSDLDRVLLVGGPTVMPILRSALTAGLGAKLDFSLDPMTVVARGAALYASTVQRTIVAPQKMPAGGTVKAEAVKSSSTPIELSYERASGVAHSPVAGIFKTGEVYEVAIDAEGGLWTSGWIAVADKRFMVDVMLNDRKPMTQFAIRARDKKGRAIALEPAQFAIAYMIPMAAPPLPHTIAVELMDHHGVMSFDPIFKRHCPLPAEARRTYKADRTLRPSDLESTLPIKFWEIDVSDDPQERWWAGCVHIKAERIKRPVIEGSELALTIKIDTSRKMTVEVFIPLLNESFMDGVYIPDPPSARSQMQMHLDLCFERLETVRRLIYETDRDDLLDRARNLQLKLERIAEQFGADVSAAVDPDAMLAPTDLLRKIRIAISQIEEQLDVGGQTELARKVRGDARWTERLVTSDGTDHDRQELERLRAQLEKYADADDPRGLKWVQQQLWVLREPIVNRLPWFWENTLNYLKAPGRRFLNREQANALITKAEAAQSSKNLPEMRDAINKAWELIPKDDAQVAKDQIAQSGLRGT